jgi:hypothetical protein
VGRPAAAPGTLACTTVTGALCADRTDSNVFVFTQSIAAGGRFPVRYRGQAKATASPSRTGLQRNAVGLMSVLFMSVTNSRIAETRRVFTEEEALPQDQPAER